MFSMSEEKECDTNHSILYRIDADKGIYEYQCGKVFVCVEQEVSFK